MIVSTLVGAFNWREFFFSFGRRNREIAAETDGVKATVPVETMSVPDLVFHGGAFWWAVERLGVIPPRAELGCEKTDHF
jgi:hypothetical protein